MHVHCLPSGLAFVQNVRNVLDVEGLGELRGRLGCWWLESGVFPWAESHHHNWCIFAVSWHFAQVRTKTPRCDWIKGTPGLGVGDLV